MYIKLLKAAVYVHIPVLSGIVDAVLSAVIGSEDVCFSLFAKLRHFLYDIYLRYCDVEKRQEGRKQINNERTARQIK